MTGPIVRITPWEIHIRDPEYYENIYSTSQAFDKPHSVAHWSGIQNAIFTTPGHELHRLRRTAIAPSFSRSKVQKKAAFIQSQADKICSRIRDEYVGNNKVLRLNDVFTCYTADVIFQYLSFQPFGFLDSPNFECAFARSMKGFKSMAHLSAQFPWIPRLASRIPEALLLILQPSLGAIIQMQNEITSLIKHAFRQRDTKKDPGHQESIMGKLLESNLPPQELSVERLKDEMTGLCGAAIETTQWALTVAFCHIIGNPSVHRRLHQELVDAIQDPAIPPALAQLEQLPYLSACISEALRLSEGAVARSPRICHHPLQWESLKIPQKVLVSMSAWDIHHDERIFPDSFAFKPERWLHDPKGPYGSKSLRHYITCFGKGTRMCLGLNLAYAEITIAVAALFRQFEFSLYETDRSDVDCYKDEIGPAPKPESKGLRVTVKRYYAARQ
ncbi:MAG: hypothetical protein Q9181_002808 [Wetmoreana brouardii]